MKRSIVHSSAGQDKGSSNARASILKRPSAAILAKRDWAEASSSIDDVWDPLIDHPLLDHLDPAGISAFYRARMEVFETSSRTQVRSPRRTGDFLRDPGSVRSA